MASIWLCVRVCRRFTYKTVVRSVPDEDVVKSCGDSFAMNVSDGDDPALTNPHPHQSQHAHERFMAVRRGVHGDSGCWVVVGWGPA
jgi:hypothetical protein